MGHFHQVKNPKLKNSKKTFTATPEALWKKCVSCEEIIPIEQFHAAHQVCPHCQHHYRLSSSERLEVILDEGSFEEVSADLCTTNPLNFVDKAPYENRLVEAKNKTGLEDACIVGLGKINGREVSIAVMDFRFMGGSMGVVTGEKIALSMMLAYEKNIPCIVVSSSGGARMQEGILSLMQLAKTSAARSKLKEKNLPYISLLTDPTTGGCAASFAMQGDLNIAEPKALIGFAGPRVIEQSIRQTLPEGFQRAEFLLKHGFIDRIIHRHQLKAELAFFLELFNGQ